MRQFSVLAVFLLSSCLGFAFLAGPNWQPSKEFKAYWLTGKREVNHYDLVQELDGQKYEGQAQLIFKAEYFSRSKQHEVQAEDEGAIPVLELNQLRSFKEGEYRLMQSVFRPIDLVAEPFCYKVSNSLQNWEGHRFDQINLRAYNYRQQQFSYASKEGDQQRDLPKVLLQDELFALIRISPEKLPLGRFEFLPSSLLSQLYHSLLVPKTAEASLSEEGELASYQLTYAQGKGSLKIQFETKFPHPIRSWEEQYYSRGQSYYSKAKLKKEK
ncbi:hypothetical protein SapgrDRAFT_0943 [Saprospira grandis DSM 2844]|uniref:Uncharacterized protein n=1 Tax=Saprospira grandis DSM 2844 TaxID=694433 RepID=J0P5G7_9BACT|nr:hypothetical protein [Saprospira grandis]EJF52672.1 hypothetical protein SapgrDRAFT_0943 [Saprospira grandis DSM 2844]